MIEVMDLQARVDKLAADLRHDGSGRDRRRGDTAPGPRPRGSQVRVAADAAAVADAVVRSRFASGSVG